MQRTMASWLPLQCANGGGGLLGIPFACGSSAAGRCQSSQTPFPRLPGAERKIDLALSLSLTVNPGACMHAVSVATEFLHQDMWSSVRVGNLFPHTQLVPVEYSVRLGRAVCPMMLLASEPGFHVRWRLSCVCHLPRGKCLLFLCVCNSSIQKPDTAGPQVSHPFLEIC